MSDFSIYRNGNCTITSTAEAIEEIPIAVDLEHLRESNSKNGSIYCEETITCGENYVALRQVLLLSREFYCERLRGHYSTSYMLIFIVLMIF